MKNKSFTALAASFLLLLSTPILSAAEEGAPELHRASGAQLSTATAHYARARSLLIAAVREFDQGLRAANPDVLIDSKEWRNSVIDRAEDLEKILAPQPAANEQGVYFTPDSRLLGEAFKR